MSPGYLHISRHRRQSTAWTRKACPCWAFPIAPSPKQKEDEVSFVCAECGCSRSGMLMRRTGATGTETPCVIAEFRTTGGVQVSVSKADICHLAVDAVVNAANEELQHIGGVALALLNAAGPELQRASNRYVSEHGNLRPGGAMVMPSYNLPCKHVVHAVGPRFDSSDQSTSVRLLKQATDVVVNTISETLNLNQGAVSKALLQAAGPHLQSAVRSEADASRCPGSEVVQVFRVLQDGCTCGRFENLHTSPTAEPQRGHRTLLTVSHDCFQVERVQNRTLWQSYQLKKQQLDSKNQHTNNEKLLFHGTGADSIEQINEHGFNRSYAGTHAAMFGKGSYFAIDPAYSARGYAPPDAKGHKRMYLARVLVGDYAQGRGGMITPPAKPPAAPNPSMFVIFNDIQAYPQHLITFH
uniref:Poly [ADP-ribose] polymerase n=1 Tax=Sphaeramia orbicularis TaxID=375764 RepID=A0A672ZYX7_9TELE